MIFLKTCFHSSSVIVSFKSLSTKLNLLRAQGETATLFFMQDLDLGAKLFCQNRSINPRKPIRILISYPDLPRSGGGEISHFDIPEPTTEIGVRDYQNPFPHEQEYFKRWPPRRPVYAIFKAKVSHHWSVNVHLKD